MGRVLMILFGFILKVTRAPLLSSFGTFFFFRWLFGTSLSDSSENDLSENDSSENDSSGHSPCPKRSILHVPDFHQTGFLVLSDVYLLNHWFVAMLGLMVLRHLPLMMWLQAQAYLGFMLFLQVIEGVWLVANREPPDPGIILSSEGDMPDTIPSCFDTKVNMDTSPNCQSVSTDDVRISTIDDMMKMDIKPPIPASSEHVQDSLLFDWTDGRSNFLRPRRVFCQALLNNNLRPSCIGGSGLDLHSRSFVVDSGSSDHLCRDKSLFVGDIRPIPGVTLQGIGGVIRAQGYGTIQLYVFDDDGLRHTLRIHNVLFVPDAPMNLLSPQQWFTGMSNEERNRRGAMAIVLDDVTLLMWGNRKHIKSIHHSPSVGLPLLVVNESLTAKVGTEDPPYPICQPCFPAYLQTSTTMKGPAIIEDDDGNITAPARCQNDQESIENIHIVPIGEDDVIAEAIDDDNTLAPEEELFVPQAEIPQYGVEADVLPPLDASDLSSNTEQELLQALRNPLSKDEEEFMLLHHKLKHLPEKSMHNMANQGIIPRKFSKMKLPPCPACILGRQHKRPWRSKRKHKNIRKRSQTRAGDGTSVDQLESRHPGLVPQTKGHHRTTQRFVGATIFVDHATSFTYVHLIKDFTAEAAMEAKNAYEVKAAEFGVRIRSYHGDNGRFAELRWVTDSEEKGQKLSFCGVGSHHQNGIAEKRIRDLTEYSRTLLIHGNQVWPEAVKLALWPYALKEAERIFNELRVEKDGLTPLQRFTKTKVSLDLKQEHPLFCPVFALDSNLQGGGKLPRWEPRSRAGVYLGRSKHHASNVALVLNLETGNVSPQYHLTFDDSFSTVAFLRNREVPPFWEDLVQKQSEFSDASCDVRPSEGALSTSILRELREAFLDSTETSSDQNPSSDGISEGDAELTSAEESDSLTHDDLLSENDTSDPTQAPAGVHSKDKIPPSSSRGLKKVRFIDELDRDKIDTPSSLKNDKRGAIPSSSEGDQREMRQVDS